MDRIPTGDHERELFAALDAALDKYQEATHCRVHHIDLGAFNTVQLLTIDVAGGCLRSGDTLRVVRHPM